MAKMLVFTFLFLILIFNFLGCTKQDSNQTAKGDKSVKNLSADIENQSVAVQAEKDISAFDGILGVNAVNIGNDLYVAAKPSQYKRFQLDPLQNDMTKKLKKEFPSYTLHVSLDSKIYKLVGQLQTKINNKEIDSETAKKKGEKIQSEMNSDT